MPALAVTLFVLALWAVQGVGFVHWLMPAVRQAPLVGWVVAVWLGLVLSLLALVNLYVLVPGVTIGELAWPVTLALSATSIGLWVWKRPRALVAARLDGFSWVILALTTIATLAVLRPLLARTELAFYFSNNGEFSNYAAMADAVMFHDSATDFGGPFAPRSREAVAGVVCAVPAALTGKAALWVLQPVAAAFAALAFACLGVLFRHGATKLGAGRLALAMLAAIYAWAILSAASQQFWTLSFVSQYVAVALWFGAVVVLAETRAAASTRIRVAVIGVTLAALLCAYPEMVIPSAALLAAFELASAEPSARARIHAAIAVAVAVGVAVVLANRLGYEFLIQRGEVGRSGWNIYGPHRPALGFVASVTGLTNPFFGPAHPHLVTVVLAAAAFAGALAHAVARAPHEPEPTLRGLYHLGWIVAVGVAVLFVMVARRGSGNNYIALKLILGFGWIAYLVLGLALARLMAWHRHLVPITLVLVALLAIDLGITARRFSISLLRSGKRQLFVESDGEGVRRALQGRRDVYIVANHFSIVGHFLAHERDLIAVNRDWPDGAAQPFTPGAPVLLVGRDYSVDEDPRVSGQYERGWAGRSVVLLEPAR